MSQAVIICRSSDNYKKEWNNNIQDKDIYTNLVIGQPGLVIGEDFNYTQYKKNQTNNNGNEVELW